MTQEELRTLIERYEIYVSRIERVIKANPDKLHLMHWGQLSTYTMVINDLKEHLK